MNVPQTGAELRDLCHATDWSTVHVYEWHGRQYALLSTIKLTTAQQMLNAVDLTDYNYWQAGMHGDTRALLWMGEGHLSVLLNNGQTPWVRDGVLPVMLTHGSNADARQHILDELDASDGRGLSSP